MAKEEVRRTNKSHKAIAFIGFIAFILLFTAVWSWVAFENANLFPLLGVANLIYVIYFFGMLLAGLVTLALFKILFSPRDDKR